MLGNPSDEFFVECVFRVGSLALVPRRRTHGIDVRPRLRVRSQLDPIGPIRLIGPIWLKPNTRATKGKVASPELSNWVGETGEDRQFGHKGFRLCICATKSPLIPGRRPFLILRFGVSRFVSSPEDVPGDGPFEIGAALSRRRRGILPPDSFD